MARPPRRTRIDTIVARVKDSFYAGSQNEFLLEVIAGTPKAGVSKPPKTRAEAEADGAGALPASSYVLAYILVPQNASTITSGDIENVSKQAAPGLPLPNESVTDAKVVKGRALVDTENKYSAETKRANNGVFEASPTRAAFVTVWSNPTSLSRVEVGTPGSMVTIGHPSGAGQQMAIFYLPPGQSWKVATGNGEEYLSNTILL